MHSENKELILRVAENIDAFEKEIREDQHHKTKLACIYAIKDVEHEFDKNSGYEIVIKNDVMHTVNAVRLGD